MAAFPPAHPTMSTPIILLPIDGSPSSLRAAQFCADVAKAFKASVVLLNVQPVIEDWQTHGLGHDAALAHLNDRARLALQESGRPLSDAGLSYATLVEFGEAAEVIAQVAADRQCSHIIMGTRGQSGVKGLLMGSVGTKVLHLVTIPVTFVH
jgi:nucleotide-binding universal stress UspA family protein